VFVRGTDANTGLVYRATSYANGRAGITDMSFLGNTYLGCNTWGNGNGTAAGNTGGMSSVVSHGGNLYQAAYANVGIYNETSGPQLALLVATTPGTNEAVWKLIGAGAPSDEFPAWQSGQASGFYFYGGCFRQGNTGRSVWMGCSSGTDEAGVVMANGFAINIGGDQPLFNYGAQINATDGGTLKMPSLYAATHPAHVWLCDGSGGNVLAFSNVANNSAARWRLGFSGGDLKLIFQNYSPNTPLTISGEDTALNFGTGSPIPYMFVAERGIVIGAGNNGRRHNTLTAAPTTGEWARGDIVYNRSPSAGGNVGWICVTAGTPGTWKAFGSIAS
jgi:hypothetical protein